MIRIVNLRDYKKQEGEILIKVDRTSIFGNPFKISKDLTRDDVCDQFEEYFKNKIENRDRLFLINLNYIYNLSKKTNVILGCWCYPKRCHSETIVKHINEMVEEYSI